jgi:hypothetical protein
MSKPVTCRYHCNTGRVTSQATEVDVLVPRPRQQELLNQPMATRHLDKVVVLPIIRSGHHQFVVARLFSVFRSTG